jgi:uncharacterized tellurite resistance protein B-like protein
MYKTQQTMTPLENLHTAIGELAYSVACADGAIQKEERDKFHAIVLAELRCKEYNFDVADIIFRVLEKDKYVDAKTSYDWAMNEIRVNSHYLSPKLKETFVRVMEKVAKAYPPVTREEISLIDKFKKDIEPIKGDPVYYE